MDTGNNIILHSAPGNLATGVATGSGFILFVNQNAALISLSIAAASFLMGLIFYVLNYRLNADKIAATKAIIARDLVELAEDRLERERPDGLEQIQKFINDIKDGEKWKNL